MLRSVCCWVICGPCLVLLLGGSARCQGPLSPIDVARAADQVMVDLIAKAERSVVAIARVEKPRPGETFNLELRPNPFGLPTAPALPASPTDSDFVANEYGTGVVIDARGLILTAYHVLGDHSDYFVTTHDRRVFRAWAKGADPRSDLAVLAVDATDLVPITFGDAAKMRKGDTVIALGNPFAIARDGQVSASRGIVSNLARKAPAMPDESDLSGRSTLHHFGTLIQTDAKLNLGTSGGPLLNLDGEMIGLTTSLAATAGYETAAGYAYPVDEAFRRAVEALRHGREVEYGFLGIQPGNLTLAEMATGLHGTRVDRVVYGTPAERAGLQSGDVITSVNRKPIHDADGLVLEVGRLPVDSEVRLGVRRRDSRIERNVVLTKYPVRGKKIVTTPAPDWRGMRIDYTTAMVDPDGGQSLEAFLFAEGVVIVDVEERTPTWDAGLRRGMLVSHVDRRPVTTPREFRDAVAGKRSRVELRYIDQEGQEPIEVMVRGS